MFFPRKLITILLFRLFYPLPALSSLNPSSPIMLHICISRLGQQWFMAWRLFGANLNQYWRMHGIVNWTLKNKLQWNFNQKKIIEENVFENVVCEMGAILFGSVELKSKLTLQVPVSSWSCQAISVLITKLAISDFEKPLLSGAHFTNMD